MSDTLAHEVAVPLDGRPPSAPASPRRLRTPLVLAFAGYPVLWFLGLGVLAFPLAGLVAAVGLLRRDGTRPALPHRVAPWFAFLAWTTTAVVVLDAPDRWIAWGYRSAMYAAATALLLWVLTADHRELDDRTVLRCLSVLWVATVLGGVAAVFVPGLELTTPVERLLPAGLLDIGLVQNTVHLQVAAESRFLGFPVGRPEAPFPFTNAWGSNLALLTPVVLATWSLGASRRWRRWTGALLVVAVVPWVFSLNRGSWLSLTAGLLYVAARHVPRLGTRRLVGLLVAAVLGVTLLFASPLGALVTARSSAGHSDAGRASLYSQSLELTTRSPLLGHGAPQPNVADPDGPSVGTHGQLWLLLVSHGVPAAVLFLAFFAGAWLAALRWRSPHSVWLEATLVVGAVQFPIYELLPAQVLTLCVVAALAIRGHRRQEAPA